MSNYSTNLFTPPKIDLKSLFLANNIVGTATSSSLLVVQMNKSRKTLDARNSLKKIHNIYG